MLVPCYILMATCAFPLLQVSTCEVFEMGCIFVLLVSEAREAFELFSTFCDFNVIERFSVYF